MPRNIENAKTEVEWINNIVTGKTELTQAVKEEISNKTVENFRDHINKGFLEYRKSATIAGDFAMTEWSGQGSIITDILGREFIDMLGGYGLYSLGIRHPKVVEAVNAQLHRSPQYSQELLDPLRAQLGRVLGELTPGDIQYGFFANSGTEGVEGALKLAKLHTGKAGFISTIGSFHGKTAGSLSVMGKSVYRKPLLPLLGNVKYAPYGDADAMEEELKKAQIVGDDIAGIIVEPVQGEAGAIVPPADYWPRLREMCDRYGVLLIADEVQTGFGRVGEMFGVDCWDVQPDIMAFGKALGGGVVPCSGFMSTAKVWECMEPNPFMHTTTTGGNPIACASALAAIGVMLEEDTPKQSAEKGIYMTGKLNELKDKYPGMINEIRGKGLLIGVEFADGDVGYKVVAGMFKRGVLCGGTLNNAQTIRIEPALTVPYELLDKTIAIMEEAIKDQI
ncbi:putrescine aminotransferase [Pontiellaceae bacterium B12227]|nr:putrescine aminotransferase [Pontiellaceae bacterium B12227]